MNLGRHYPPPLHAGTAPRRHMQRVDQLQNPPRRAAVLPSIAWAKVFFDPGPNRPPQDRRRRPQRWRDAVQTLVDLQAEYQDWFDSLPENLRASSLAERLEAVCEYDFGDLEALEPPRGFGRD